MPIGNMPVGTIVHNVELKIGKGGAIARSAGNYAQITGMLPIGIALPGLMSTCSPDTTRSPAFTRCGARTEDRQGRGDRPVRGQLRPDRRPRPGLRDAAPELGPIGIALPGLMSTCSPDTTRSPAFTRCGARM
jgi:hypothetical protein